MIESMTGKAVSVLGGRLVSDAAIKTTETEHSLRSDFRTRPGG